MTRHALVTGLGGQDGVLLARHLLSEGCRVVGTTRPGSPSTMLPYLAGVVLEEHDLRDHARFDRLLADHQPDEVYNLAGFTSVGASWDHPELVEQVNAVAVEHMLASLVDHDKKKPVRFFQASTSEVFGPDAVNPQTESTPHHPRNPYGSSKSRAHLATTRCRDEHGLHATVGILYNHESAVRPRRFVTRKIVRAAVEIAEGLASSVTLGNLEVSRDWGAARDYVGAMSAAVRQDEPGDYVIATGQLHTLHDLLTAAFNAAGIEDPWPHVRQDPNLLRAADAPGLAGDATHARSRLGWASSTTFEQLVAEMVTADVKRVRSGVEESPEYLLP